VEDGESQSAEEKEVVRKQPKRTAKRVDKTVTTVQTTVSVNKSTGEKLQTQRLASDKRRNTRRNQTIKYNPVNY
jgi:hypothetical protein